MKLKPFKVGQLTVIPRMQLLLIAALFILGLGIGATAASPNASKIALLFCCIVSLFLILYAFLKKGLILTFFKIYVFRENNS